MVECEPEIPASRHIWVRGHGDIGPPEPGLILSWQHSPVHNATNADWVALVATCPFDTALCLQWVSAERLLLVCDPAPVEPAATGRRPPAGTGRRRHVWLETGGARQPGLVIAWRRTSTGTWEAQVAAAHIHTMLLTWTPADQLRPIADDRRQASRA